MAASGRVWCCQAVARAAENRSLCSLSCLCVSWLGGEFLFVRGCLAVVARCIVIDDVTAVVPDAQGGFSVIFVALAGAHLAVLIMRKLIG